MLKDLPTLEDIRSKYQELAKFFAINDTAKYTVKGGRYPGPFPTRAYKTGRLYKSIAVLLTSKESQKVVLDLAAVRYGIFLNSGWKSSKGKIVRRPFAVAAANDKQLAQMIDAYQKGVMQKVVLEQMQLIGQKLSLFGVARK